MNEIKDFFWGIVTPFETNPYDKLNELELLIEKVYNDAFDEGYTSPFGLDKNKVKEEDYLQYRKASFNEFIERVDKD